MASDRGWASARSRRRSSRKRLAMNGDAVTGAPYEELLAGAGAHSAAAIGDPVHVFDAARSVDDLPADPAGFSTGGVL